MARSVMLALIVWGLMVVSPAAIAQEYGESLGDLAPLPALVADAETVPLQGSGFAAGSTVEISLMSNETGEVVSLGVATTESSGDLDASVSVPEGLAPGAYTISVSGEAVDGGTRVLTGSLQAGEETTGSETTSTVGGDDSEALAVEDDDGSGGGVPPAVVVGAVVVVSIAVAGGAFWLLSRSGIG
jgi:hypothetical protein